MEETIKCPKCCVDMVKITNNKYVLDRCPSCGGVFLDREEVENINRQGFIQYILNYFRRG